MSFTDPMLCACVAIVRRRIWKFSLGKLATIIGERTTGRLLSATSMKVGNGFRLALPTGVYYTWRGTVLEGTPIEPDELVEFDWWARRGGNDRQIDRAGNRHSQSEHDQAGTSMSALVIWRQPPFEPVLLGPECLHRIQPGRAPCWSEAGQNRNSQERSNCTR